MTTAGTRQQILAAVAACEDKKAGDITILQLEQDTTLFTDFFVICSGTNPRQIEAIADEVDLRLSRLGENPTHIEGRNRAEWVLVDYVDFVVHIFSEQSRKFYDLERLWKSAKRMTPEEFRASAEEKPAKAKKTAAKKPFARKTVGKKASPKAAAKPARKKAIRKKTGR